MVKVWMHQGSVLPSSLFAAVVDVVTELDRGSDLFHADDLVSTKQLREAVQKMAGF